MKKYIKLSIIPIIIFSMLMFKTPAVSTISTESSGYKVKLGGEAFGIKMFSDGVIVTEVADTLSGCTSPSPANLAGIEKNDIIKYVDGETLKSNEQLTQKIVHCNTKLNLGIERNGKLIYKDIYPQKDSKGNKRAGMWVKDSAAGIGTITYYDTATGTFGALGHAVCEASTGTIIPLSYGEVTTASITDITKSSNGSVGSLNGFFESKTIGEALINTEEGLFGTISNNVIDKEYIYVAEKDEVELGDAKIYCSLDSDGIKSYDIKIKRFQNTGCSQGMVIEIVDEELLELTGGIVQGMSGSPIVQNDKLIGAVTHVLVNNVKCGYGIYIEEMLNTAQEIC